MAEEKNRSWRRISTGKLSFLYSEEKNLPNYLRSPTGSCHDVCKYGRKHESEDNKKKPRVSPLKRVNRSFSETLNLDSPLRKKKALTKSVLLNPSGRKCDSSVDVKKENEAEIRTEKKAVSSRFVVDSTDKRKKKKKTVSQSLKTIGVSWGTSLSKSKEMVEHSKRVTALKLKSVAQTAALALRRSTTVNKNEVNVPKTAEPKKEAVPSRASMFPKRYSRSFKTKKDSSSLSVPLRKTRKEDKDLVQEKTLYVIKMKTGNEIVESDQNQRCVMDSLTVDPKSQLEQNKARTRKAFSSAVNVKSTKLRFKRGKILDVVGSQDNSPRKLKFKRGKIVTGADTTSKSGTYSRRSLKTKGTNFSNDKEQQHKPKVVLKHQETQKKRDSRVLLFNNVIEETANKLVETRKSKVKALVGAFESVISLQERNSSAKT